MRTVNTGVFDILRGIFSGGEMYRVSVFLEEVLSEDTCPKNMTGYLVYSTLDKLIEDYKLGADVSKEEYEEFISSLLEFMNDSGMGLWFYQFSDPLSPAFEEYVGEYLDNLHEDKDFTGEFIASVYYYLSGVANSDHPERVEGFKPFIEMVNKVREKDSYRGLMDEYSDFKSGVDDKVLKSVTPVDISNLPEYLLDSLYFHEGKYYRPSDIRKMITASSQVAQSLERQDLEEEEEEEENLSAEEMGRKYIKKLKRDKK